MLVYASQDALYSLQRVDFLTHSACNPLPKPVAPHSVFVQLNVPPALPPAPPGWISPYFGKAITPQTEGPPPSQSHPPAPFSVLPDSACPADEWSSSGFIHPPCRPVFTITIPLRNPVKKHLSCASAVLEDSNESPAGARATPAKRIWLIQKVSPDQSLMADIHFLHYLSCVC